MSLATTVAALADYSWSDIAKAAKQAMLMGALGGSRLVINGRDIERISMKEAMDLYNMAIDQIADENLATQGGIALVRYGERV